MNNFKRKIRTLGVHRYLSIDEVGVCPNCGSCKITYDNQQLEGDQVGYDFVCEECETKSTEWYTLTFSETTSDQV